MLGLLKAQEFFHSARFSSHTRFGELSALGGAELSSGGGKNERVVHKVWMRLSRNL